MRKHVITTAGTPEHLGGWMKNNTISYDSSTKTIADSDSAFITKGFKAGDVIDLSGSTSNDGTYTISTIAAGSIVVVEDIALTEIAGDVTTITANSRHPQDVDDGISVVIRANPANTGYVYIGSSSANALSSSNNNMPLSPNSTCSMQVTNLNSIWVDTATSANSVIYQFES